MKKWIALVVIVSTLFSCVKENTNGNIDNYNRQKLLSNWVEHSIIPSFIALETEVQAMQTIKNSFANSATQDDLNKLKNNLFEAQKAWQYTAMFDLGQNFEDLASFRLFTGNYPVDPVLIKEQISNMNTTVDVNFNSSASIHYQGLNAIDYLVNSDTFTSFENKENYQLFLSKVIDALLTRISQRKTYWETNKETIINNTNKTATGSFSVMINDYISYAEQELRTAKIGNPSGIFPTFTTSKNPQNVESYYSSENSKALFIENLKALKNLFYGASYDGSIVSGSGIQEYLIFLNSDITIGNQTVLLSKYIEKNFDDTDAAVANLDDDFAKQVETDNAKMIALYSVLQDFIPLLKTNMMQVLNINIDYVDSDGD